MSDTAGNASRELSGSVASPDAIATWRVVATESGRYPEIGRIFIDRGVQHNQTALSNLLAHHVTLGSLRDVDPA